MPTYTYVCTACSHNFEIVQAITDASLSTCPECGGSLRKVFHPVGVAFKGSGFYRTDSRTKPAGEGSDGSGSSDSGSSDSGSSDSGGSGTKDSGASDRGSGTKQKTSGTSDKSSHKTASKPPKAPTSGGKPATKS